MNQTRRTFLHNLLSALLVGVLAAISVSAQTPPSTQGGATQGVGISAITVSSPTSSQQNVKVDWVVTLSAVNTVVSQSVQVDATFLNGQTRSTTKTVGAADRTTTATFSTLFNINPTNVQTSKIKQIKVKLSTTIRKSDGSTLTLTATKDQSVS